MHIHMYREREGEREQCEIHVCMPVGQNKKTCLEFLYRILGEIPQECAERILIGG